mgnify:CR=1 FL=1
MLSYIRGAPLVAHCPSISGLRAFIADMHSAPIAGQESLVAANQLRWPAVHFDATVDAATKETLTGMVKRAHGSVVGDYASATHVVHKGAAADDDEGI